MTTASLLTAQRRLSPDAYHTSSAAHSWPTDHLYSPGHQLPPYMEQIADSGADAWIVTWAGGGFG
ncbi:MAG: hypothetical protein H6649_08075 [Caldilineae bacterium]|nr:hypothetical protein [Caldilineae bacterium]